MWSDLTYGGRSDPSHADRDDGPGDSDRGGEGGTSGVVAEGAAPRGRVGHLSDVRGDCLYVFGGLTYSMGTFHVEFGDYSERGGLGIWKACGLDELLLSPSPRPPPPPSSSLKDDGERSEEGGGTRVEGLKWERVVAKVDLRMPTPPAGDGGDTDDALDNNSVGGGDESESKEEDGGDADGDHSASEDDSHGRMASDRQGRRDAGWTVKPARTLPRGEAQGGHYARGSSRGDCFVFYGGIHHHHTISDGLSLRTTRPGGGEQQATTILGDVWEFEYATETLRMLSPYPPLEWQVSHVCALVSDEEGVCRGATFLTPPVRRCFPV